MAYFAVNFGAFQKPKKSGFDSFFFHSLFFVKMNRLRRMYAALGFDVNNHWVLQFKSSPGARQLLPRHKSTVPLVLVNSTQSLKVQFSIPPHQTQLPSTDPEATNPNGLSPNPQMNYVSIAFSIEARMLSSHELQSVFVRHSRTSVGTRDHETSHGCSMRCNKQYFSYNYPYIDFQRTCVPMVVLKTWFLQGNWNFPYESYQRNFHVLGCQTRNQHKFPCTIPFSSPASNLTVISSCHMGFTVWILWRRICTVRICLFQIAKIYVVLKRI